MDSTLDESIFGCDVQVESIIMNKSDQEIENSDYDEDYAERIAYYKRQMAYVTVKPVERLIVEEEAQMEEVLMNTVLLEVGSAVAEAMHSEPQLGHVLPITNKIESFEHTYLSSKDFRNKIHSVVYTKDGYVQGVMQPNLILNDRNKDSRDELLMRSNKHDIHTATKSVMVKSVQMSKFNIEKDCKFPINAQNYPNIIETIESSLNCFEKFQFRASFSNVSFIRQREIEPQNPIVTRMLSAEAIENLKHQRFRKCICQTQLYKHLDKYKRFGSMMRLLYNNMLTFNKSQIYHTALQCEIKEAKSTQCAVRKVRLLYDDYGRKTIEDGTHFLRQNVDIFFRESF
ncbi:uncharacterized protein LOC111872733 [Cryptotermes secundus]|uniref:uncharacterized protein LOC111872733 n=1 Tax=Cryptotermes secundus TaxID=105785 RepID=UPI000CD7AA70|nr:uncharacterized protein LOC111872733 [Cryptotermes secundus]